MLMSDDSPSLTVELLRRTLALFDRERMLLQVEIVDHSEAFLELAISSPTGGSVTLLFVGGEALPERFDMSASRVTGGDRGRLSLFANGHETHLELRTLGDLFVLDGPGCDALVRTRDGRAVWTRRRRMGRTVVAIGTALSSDLLTYRQGLEENVHSDLRTEALFGFPNERPIYLYEGVADPTMPYDRQADWWSKILFESLQDDLFPTTGTTTSKPVRYLVITGDDDQADLETYDEQQKILRGMPITYFLHPLTHHTRGSIRRLHRANPQVEFGLHPDALDNPERYDDLFSKQVDWFRNLTGTTPLSVRNHGFLSDAYWNHLRSWIAHGVRASSNIPGLDGRILSNSLVPFPLALDGEITDHWSIVTSFGDGMIFALEMSDEEASQKIEVFASRMAADPIDGALVVNLHPQNVERARKLHHAVRDLVDDGFVPVTLSSLIQVYGAGRIPETRGFRTRLGLSRRRRS